MDSKRSYPEGGPARAALLPVLLSVLLLAVAASSATAQDGAIAGTVRAEADAAAMPVDTEPTGLATVRVAVLRPDSTVVAETLTSEAGTFRIENIPAGTYTVVFGSTGWQTLREEVTVVAGRTLSMSVRLAEHVYNLNPINITASKVEEKVLEAPAAVEVISTTDIEERPATTVADHVEEIAAVDVIRTGLQGSYVVVRGFNNIFSGATLTMTDNRIAHVPSLRANILHLNPTTNYDIDRVEVVLGPGSALYGPNAANGVIHSITKSPLDDPGGTFSVATGLRQQQSVAAIELGDSLGDVDLPPDAETIEGFPSSSEPVVHLEGRYAMRLGENFGVKLSGQYFTGDEYYFNDTEEAEQRALARSCLAAGMNPTLSSCQNFAQGLDLSRPDDVEVLVQSVRNVAGGRDFGLDRWSADVRADWRVDRDLTLIFSGGRTHAGSSLDLTGLGAAQVRNWAYNYVQARAVYRSGFAQFFFNQSDNDETFLLRSGRPLIDRSYMMVGQLQNATRVSERQSFVYGLDYLRTVPRTEGTINGLYEGDDETSEIGGYVQSETGLGDRWKAVGAARLDHHSRLDGLVFSPRAALVFTPEEGHSLRATYNRAFSTPNTLNMFLDISGGTVPLGSGFAYDIRAQGAAESGFQFSRTNGVPDFRSPFYTPLLGFEGSPMDFQPTTTANVWDIAVRLVEANNPDAGQLLRSLPVPGEEQVPVEVRMLDPSLAASGAADPFREVEGGLASIDDVPALQPTITNTFEAGYKGLLGDRFLLAANAYYSRISNFTSPLRMSTPNVFLGGPEIAAYLGGFGVPSEQAEAIAGSMARIPVGVITPTAAGGQIPSLVLTYHDLPDFDLYGADLTGTLIFNDRWQVDLGVALVSEDTFEPEGEDEVAVPLNAATAKGTGSIRFRDEDRGLNAQLGGRFLNGFPAASGVYEGEVEGHGVVDLTLGYRLPGLRDATLQLDVQNLLDSEYRTYVGTPVLGRFTILRLKYDL